ncbi:hypothetical protein [Sclerotinia sclerotiorum reovirus 1]|nr:hypothetical protein [Sclerotinia sclerotiorum reovirus 1]
MSIPFPVPFVSIDSDPRLIVEHYSENIFFDYVNAEIESKTRLKPFEDSLVTKIVIVGKHGSLKMADFHAYFPTIPIVHFSSQAMDIDHVIASGVTYSRKDPVDMPTLKQHLREWVDDRIFLLFLNPESKSDEFFDEMKEVVFTLPDFNVRTISVNASVLWINDSTVPRKFGLHYLYGIHPNTRAIGLIASVRPHVKHDYALLKPHINELLNGWFFFSIRAGPNSPLAPSRTMTHADPIGFHIRQIDTCLDYTSLLNRFSMTIISQPPKFEEHNIIDTPHHRSFAYKLIVGDRIVIGDNCPSKVLAKSNVSKKCLLEMQHDYISGRDVFSTAHPTLLARTSDFMTLSSKEEFLNSQDLPVDEQLTLFTIYMDNGNDGAWKMNCDVVECDGRTVHNASVEVDDVLYAATAGHETASSALLQLFVDIRRKMTESA